MTLISYNIFLRVKSLTLTPIHIDTFVQISQILDKVLMDVSENKTM